MKRYQRPTKGKAWTKQFVMRSASTPTKGWTTPYKQRAFSGMRGTDPLLRMFGLDLGQGGPERMAIVRRLQAVTIDVQLEHHICLEHTYQRKVFMFYCIGANRYYFVCEEFRGRRIRKSIVYGTRARALWCYNNDPIELTKIKWEEEDWIEGKETIEVRA